MTAKDANAVIAFSDTPLNESARRLTELPDRVVEGDPHHVTRMHFDSPDGGLLAGTWTSTPGKWHTFADRDEFCYIVSGYCRLIDEDGNARTFKTGDAFLIPNGFKGFWDVVETTTKHFVIRNHAAS